MVVVLARPLSVYYSPRFLQIGWDRRAADPADDFSAADNFGGTSLAANFSAASRAILSTQRPAR